MPITELIDKRDWLEVVRDAIASILLTESASQQQLATDEGKPSPELWALRVFSDRARPWPQFLERPDQIEATPIVNVLVDTTEAKNEASDPVNARARRVTFRIDCYGYGLSQDDGGSGHVSGDRKAALEAQRAARLVRNTLMSGPYTYLGLRGIVWRRMVRSIEAFDPETPAIKAGQNIRALSVTLDVEVAEDSPQVVPESVHRVRVTLDETTHEITLGPYDWPVDQYVHSPPAYVEPVIDAGPIGTLIDKQDNFEIVRSQVAALLALETTNQQALATADGEDPRLWKLRVFEERSDPWAEFLQRPNELDAAPIVNVYLETTTIERSGSDPVRRQTYTGRIHIDCYGYGLSHDDGADGHVAGDEGAAHAAQRAARLVRNILMAGEYTYLGLRGTVGKRSISSTTAYRPEPLPAQNVAIVRLVLEAKFVELSPQVEEVSVGAVQVSVTIAPSGEVLVLQYPASS